MHDQYRIGETNRLAWLFLDHDHEPADPTAVALTITRPDATTIVKTIGDLTHDGTGRYHYDLTLDLDGVWTSSAVPSGNDVSDVQVDYFLVGASTDFEGPCAAWIDGQDVFDLAPLSEIAEVDRDYGLAAEMAEVASRLLFALTEYRYPGICRDVVRPCRRFHSWAPVGWRSGWGSCGCGAASRHACTCSDSAEIELGGSPILGIVEVRVDGAVLSPATYRVDDGNVLRRLDGVWPSHQDLDADPATDIGTFQVIDFYGKPPPADGVLAAKAWAGQFYLANIGSTKCKLPQRLQSISRQGETMTFIDPLDFLTDGNTGILQVDYFLNAERYAAANRETVVASPDFLSTIRRTA